ncbi:unnamed protein product, partial [Polarella glacialis]
FEYLPVLFLIASVGHLPHSQQDFAASALGRNFFNSSWSIAWGFTAALHTLAPQAEGAGRSDLHALNAQRAFWIVTVVCVPLALLQGVSAKVLTFLGQDPALCALAQPFAIRLIPRLFVEGYFTILQRMGQAMGHASAVAALTFVGCAGAPIFLWLFVDQLGLGYLGAAWACTAWTVVNMFALAIFMFLQRGPGRGRSLFVPYKPFRHVFSWQGFREYLELAIPSTLHACLEWWAMDLGVMLAAGLLLHPDLNLGANAVVSCVADICYMMWLGVQGATSIAVGTHIGAGRAKAAQRTIRISVMMGLCGAAVVSLGIILGRHTIAAALDESPDVQAKAADAMLVLAVHVFPDSVNCVLGGALRGMGRQSRGVQFQFAGFYLLGMPLCVLLLHQYRADPFGLASLWLAVVCAVTTSSLCCAVYISRADWDSVISEARARNS